MQYVHLGRSGLRVSRLCLGTMNFGPRTEEPQAFAIMDRAHEQGLNFFDTANVYGRTSQDQSGGRTEEIVGRWLAQGEGRRERTVLATKVYGNMGTTWPNEDRLSALNIRRAADASLRRLQTDYIDLYQTHRWDYETPIEETLEALHDAVKAGKVRYIGASSMYAWQFAKALYLARLNGWTRFVSMQNHLNLLYREEEREMMGLCKSEGIAVIPWSPLARGRLTRPWQSATTKRVETDFFGNAMYAKTEEADRKVVDALGQLAEKRGTPRAQLALAWLLSKPGVTAPIVGASKAHHLEDAVAALNVKLTAEEIAELEAPYIPHPVLGYS